MNLVNPLSKVRVRVKKVKVEMETSLFLDSIMTIVSKRRKKVNKKSD